MRPEPSLVESRSSSCFLLFANMCPRFFSRELQENQNTPRLRHQEIRGNSRQRPTEASSSFTIQCLMITSLTDSTTNTLSADAAALPASTRCVVFLPEALPSTCSPPARAMPFPSMLCAFSSSFRMHYPPSSSSSTSSCISPNKLSLDSALPGDTRKRNYVRKRAGGGGGGIVLGSTFQIQPI